MTSLLSQPSLSKRPRPTTSTTKSKTLRTFLSTIKPHWLERTNVDRRSSDDLSKEEFITKYEAPGVPVILTGIVSKWQASTEWTREKLLQRFPDRLLRVSATRDMTLKDYFDYVDQCDGTEERPLYLFDKDFCLKIPEMNDEFNIPKYFEQDLMSVLGEEKRPDYKWLIIGPALSGSSFHVDPNCNFAWNATIQGRKKWILYPPGCPPPVSGAEDRQLCLPQWFHEHYDNDECVDQRMECITEAGECMYVPRGWWHCVLNLEPCVAITHNVVTTQNLLPVVDFLEQASISCRSGEGCRGSIKFHFSGDVPTSVIYPYPDELVKKVGEEEKDAVVEKEVGEEEEEEAGGAEGGGEGDMCACSLEQYKLLINFQRGLARDHPGLLESLYAKRDVAKKRWWESKKEIPNDSVEPDETGGAGGAGGAGGGAAEFSFGFSFT